MRLSYQATVVAYGDRGAPRMTGTVTFSDGGIVIAGCDTVTIDTPAPTTCTVTYTAGGPRQHHITATYSGDDAYQRADAKAVESVK